MNIADRVLKTIEQDDPGVLVSSDREAILPTLILKKESLVRVLFLLRDQFSFESLMCETASDQGDRIVLIYHLFSMQHCQTLVVKVELSHEKPSVDTAEEVWKSANFYEREIYDLFGVEFIGHSDLVRILLPQDWVGHPLRKDYRPAEEYHGMKIEC